MKKSANILVTGSNGQLGSELNALADQYPQFSFLFTDRNSMPVSDKDAIAKVFAAFKPDYFINCAAYTAVDKAEDPLEITEAEKINSDAVGYLAEACQRFGAKMIHISTDYVFDGAAVDPYKPSDKTNPVSVYGKTKLKGEEQATELTDPIIIRTAWVYSSFGKNFVKTMMRLMAEKSSIGVVSDQYGTPTYARDLAKVILDIINSENWLPGIYHYSNEGAINWYDFAVEIKEHIKSTCEVNAIPTSAYPTPAKRPSYSVLDKTLLKERYNILIPDWKSSLKDCIELIKKGEAA